MLMQSLPHHLQRPLAEVKSYVEKMPEGVKLTTVVSKVAAFGRLSKKDKTQIIQHLNQRESIHIIQARALTGKNLTMFLRHRKYGYPDAMPGYDWPEATTPAPKPEPAPEFEPTEPATEDEPEAAQAQQPEPVETPTMQIVATNTTPSPEALRRQAESLLRAAEEAERRTRDTDFLNKKLGPVKLEIYQATGQLQRKLDEIIDALDAVNKAVLKLKDLAA